MKPVKTRCPHCGESLEDPSSYRLKPGGKRYIYIMCECCEKVIEKKIDLRSRRSSKRGYDLIG